MRSQALLYNDLRERREAVRHLDLFSGIGGFALAAYAAAYAAAKLKTEILNYAIKVLVSK